MRILELQAENVKRIKCITITPKGPMVQITGNNESGKSSTLDVIYWTLAGEKHIDEEPLRRGSDRGRGRLDLGDFIVERVFRKSGTTELTVRDGTKRAPGKKDTELPKYGSPQELLDGLLGQMTFDPLAFSRMKPREQFDELRRIAKVSIDIDALEAQNAADFEKRGRVNKDVKALRARVEALMAPDERPTAVDEAALVTELQNAGSHNTEIEKRRLNREQATTTAQSKRYQAAGLKDYEEKLKTDANRDIADFEHQIATLRRRIETRHAQYLEDQERNTKEREALVSQADELEQKLVNAEPPPELIDVATVRQRLDLAKGTNGQVAAFDQRKTLADELAALESEAAALTASMASREEQKQQAIMSAEMPIDGLSLAEGKVFFNGFPFSQASDAQRLRVSAAIGMAGNPEIRVMRIKDGDKLDDNGLKLLQEMALERDWQIWVEMVRGAGPSAIVMVDGEIAEDVNEFSAEARAKATVQE